MLSSRTMEARDVPNFKLERNDLEGWRFGVKWLANGAEGSQPT
ncbi:hypothetical protein CKA32_003057 [Geitlerinema sp. FC II]|nr:hypothetical protein CKA32_003057 [Geitlerinema sp. FC II]